MEYLANEEMVTFNFAQTRREESSLRRRVTRALSGLKELTNKSQWNYLEYARRDLIILLVVIHVLVNTTDLLIMVYRDQHQSVTWYLRIASSFVFTLQFYLHTLSIIYWRRELLFLSALANVPAVVLHLVALSMDLNESRSLTYNAYAVVAVLLLPNFSLLMAMFHEKYRQGSMFLARYNQF